MPIAGHLAFFAATLAAAAAWSAAGCATLDAGPRVVPISPDRGPRASIEDVRDYADAIALVADILERDVGLPPVDGALYLYADRPRFEAALREQGYSEALARDASEMMAAIGGAGRVLANASALAGQTWPQRVATLAHELAHVAQYDLGGGTRGTSDQWLREGFAELVSHRVLESLGLLRVAQTRQRAWRLVADAAATTSLPRLAALATFPDWVGAGTAYPRAPLYPLALVAADRLVRDHGLQAVLAYFARFASSSDREQNFRTAFGETIESFDERLSIELRNARRAR